jgi:hypothetical protein
VTVSKPQPIVPEYQGANVRGIIPALLGPSQWYTSLPDWMPEPVTGSDSVVLLVLDGLGWDQLNERSEYAPTLMSMVGRAITTVAPTTTATALSSITTGLAPAEHGILGYRMLLSGEVINTLRWCVDNVDRRRVHRPADIQPYPGFMGREVPVVGPYELQGSAFTEAHMSGCRSVGWRSASSIPVEVGALVRSGERFVYAYYAGIDKVSHERGLGEYYLSELRTVDRLVGDILEALPSDTTLLITADHGQVHVGDNIVYPSDRLLSMVHLQSGEGRFRWLHARRGAEHDLLAAAQAEFGHQAWVVSKQQVLDEGWFGPQMAPPLIGRLGDVALVPFEPVSFHDPDDTGPYELISRHGSLTSAEVYVPLLAQRV